VSKQPRQQIAVACCAPLGVEPMRPSEAETLAAVMKALGDPVRLRLMSMIAAADEVCVCELTPPFDVSAPTISHHLKVLRDVGLVDSERRGTWVYYRARRDTLAAVGGLFASTGTSA